MYQQSSAAPKQGSKAVDDTNQGGHTKAEKTIPWSPGVQKKTKTPGTHYIKIEKNQGHLDERTVLKNGKTAPELCIVSDYLKLQHDWFFFFFPLELR